MAEGDSVQSLPVGKDREAQCSSDFVQRDEYMCVRQTAEDYRRQDHLTWDQYFMLLAFSSSARSKDPHRKIGACIVNPENKRILAMGYNGLAEDVPDTEEKWSRDRKDYYVCHAVMNAILNKFQNDIKGCHVYTTHAPCSSCARYLLQIGIIKIFHYDVKCCTDDPKDLSASKEMLGNKLKSLRTDVNIDVPSTSDQIEDKRAATKFRDTDERLTWDQYFMGIAFISAQRSKDPKRQVGACIVNSKNRILSIGYNGMPDHIADCDENWEPETKETFVCHAELNAVLNRGANDVSGCKMYVTYYPCSNCAKVIIQSGVKRVVYYDMYSEKRRKDGEAASKMLSDAEVEIIPYQKQKGTLKIKASTEAAELTINL